MPRVLSPEFIADLNAQNSGEAIIVLIEIDHPEMPEALRVTSDNVDTISNGDTFIAYPFRITLPDAPEDGKSPRAAVEIDNVTREILDTLRLTSSSPYFDLRVVRASAPDVIEGRWPGFRLAQVPYTAETVRGELTLDDIYLLEFPAHDYLPIWFPALF